MDLASIRLIPVLVATLAAFAVGALWYGPLFGKRWQALIGLSDEDIAGGAPGLTYGGAFVLQLIAVTVLSVVIGPDATLLGGALKGAGVAAAWVGTAMGVNDLFSQTPAALSFLNVGYHITYYTVAGTILAAFG